MRYAIIQVAGKPNFPDDTDGEWTEYAWERTTPEGEAYSERFRVLRPWTDAQRSGTKREGTGKRQLSAAYVSSGFEEASYGVPKSGYSGGALGGILLVAENDYGDYFAAFVHPEGGAEANSPGWMPPMRGGETLMLALEKVLGWFDRPSPLSQSLVYFTSPPHVSGYVKSISVDGDWLERRFRQPLQIFAAPAPGGTTNLVFMPRLASRYDIVEVLGLPTTEGITLFDAITEQLVASPLDVGGGLPLGTPGIDLGAPGGLVDSGTITAEPDSGPSITGERLSPDGFQQDITGGFGGDDFVQGPSDRSIIPSRSSRPDVKAPEPESDELGDDPFDPPDFESSDDDLSLGDDEGVETKDNSALALAALAGALLLMRG